jgi:hypothetical protein
MLVPLILSGLALLAARRTYSTDVATAIESEHRIARRGKDRARKRPLAPRAARKAPAPG